LREVALIAHYLKVIVNGIARSQQLSCDLVLIQGKSSNMGTSRFTFIHAVLILIFCGVGFAQTSQQDSSEKPEAVVMRLYHEVATRRPLGIPKGADKAAIWPLLSTRLVRVLDTAQSCENDYFRQRAGKDGKPEFSWLETGLFSGENEEGIPSSALVQRADGHRDGSFWVFVRLTYRESFETYGRKPNPANKFNWRVVAIVKPEAGQFVVDDIVRFDESSKKQLRLSESFVGCSGSRWVGE